MKVIMLLNEKGGVGKTTLAVNLACGIALRGHQTLFIDADAQADATTKLLGLTAYGALYNLLVRPEEPDGEWERCIRKVNPNTVGQGGAELYVVRGSQETRNIANSASGGILNERLLEIADIFEYVVIDAAPTPDLFHAMLLASSDYVIIPTQAEVQSFGGVNKTIEHAQKVALLAGGAQVIGIIPNMVRNMSLHEQVIGQLEHDYPTLVWDKIVLSAVFPEAAATHQSVFAYAPNHARTADMWSIVNRTIGVTING
ncbi:MAG: ParA family protein [Phototrophicaceae bacterium]